MDSRDVTHSRDVTLGAQDMDHNKADLVAQDMDMGNKADLVDNKADWEDCLGEADLEDYLVVVAGTTTTVL